MEKKEKDQVPESQEEVAVKAALNSRWRSKGRLTIAVAVVAFGLAVVVAAISIGGGSDKQADNSELPTSSSGQQSEASSERLLAYFGDVYSSNIQLYTYNRDGSSPQPFMIDGVDFSEVGRISLSPDGSTLAVASDGLYLYDTATMRLDKVLEDTPSGITWYPDSSGLIFTVSRYIPSEADHDGNRYGSTNIKTFRYGLQQSSSSFIHEEEGGYVGEHIVHIDVADDRYYYYTSDDASISQSIYARQLSSGNYLGPQISLSFNDERPSEPTFDSDFKTMYYVTYDGSSYELHRRAIGDVESKVIYSSEKLTGIDAVYEPYVSLSTSTYIDGAYAGSETRIIDSESGELVKYYEVLQPCAGSLPSKGLIVAAKTCKDAGLLDLSDLSTTNFELPEGFSYGDWPRLLGVINQEDKKVATSPAEVTTAQVSLFGGDMTLTLPDGWTHQDSYPNAVGSFECPPTLKSPDYTDSDERLTCGFLRATGNVVSIERQEIKPDDQIKDVGSLVENTEAFVTGGVLFSPAKGTEEFFEVDGQEAVLYLGAYEGRHYAVTLYTSQHRYTFQLNGGAYYDGANDDKVLLRKIAQGASIKR